MFFVRPVLKTYKNLNWFFCQFPPPFGHFSFDLWNTVISESLLEMTAGGNNEASDASNRHFNVKRASYGSNNVNFNASVGNITVNQGCCKCQESKINLTRSCESFFVLILVLCIPASTQSVQSEQNAKGDQPISSRSILYLF